MIHRSFSHVSVAQMRLYEQCLNSSAQIFWNKRHGRKNRYPVTLCSCTFYKSVFFSLILSFFFLFILFINNISVGLYFMGPFYLFLSRYDILVWKEKNTPFFHLIISLFECLRVCRSFWCTWAYAFDLCIYSVFPGSFFSFLNSFWGFIQSLLNSTFFFSINNSKIHWTSSYFDRVSMRLRLQKSFGKKVGFV